MRKQLSCSSYLPPCQKVKEAANADEQNSWSTTSMETPPWYEVGFRIRGGLKPCTLTLKIVGTSTKYCSETWINNLLRVAGQNCLKMLRKRNSPLERNSSACAKRDVFARLIFIPWFAVAVQPIKNCFSSKVVCRSFWWHTLPLDSHPLALPFLISSCSPP